MKASDLPESGALLAGVGVAIELVATGAVAGAWERPSDLPGYTVGGVAGHLARAVQRCVATLQGPAPDGEPATFDEWYLANRVATAEDLEDDLARWLVADGQELAAGGPAEVAGLLRADAAALAPLLATEPAARTVAVARTAKPVPLRDYLASRVLEVVVHADDVAAGAGIEPPAFPDDVIELVTTTLLRMARARSGDTAVIRALTRRERVEDPYDVLRVL